MQYNELKSLLDMHGQAGQPLLAADDERGAHEVVVDGVREMIGGYAVRL